MDSSGQRAIAQRSEDDREEWAAEQEVDWQETGETRDVLRMAGLGLGLPSQRMQLKGEQGNHTRSLPVSM